MAVRQSYGKGEEHCGRLAATMNQGGKMTGTVPHTLPAAMNQGGTLSRPSQAYEKLAKTMGQG